MGGDDCQPGKRLGDVLTRKLYPHVYCVSLSAPRQDRVSLLNVSQVQEKQINSLQDGQLVTVLSKKRVEIVYGIDAEGKFFKIRKDRDPTVEVMEEQHVVYNFNVAEHFEPSVIESICTITIEYCFTESQLYIT